jgi:hypothetical protein
MPCLFLLVKRKGNKNNAQTRKFQIGKAKEWKDAL